LLVAGALLIAPGLADSRAGQFSLALVYGSIMLSMTLLTGYGGYLNLAPLTFAGIGSLTVSKLDTTSPYAFLVAAAVCGAIGAALGLLAIRLGALYLAIATLAFAELADYVIFQSNFGFAYGSQALVERASIFGISIDSEQRFLVFAAICFVALGMLVLWLRRGRYGRLLIALRDSPAACGTLGLNLTLTRVGVFAISSAMAGFAGALLANRLVSFGAKDFIFIQNLPLVLCVVIGGVTSVTGALLGGILLTALTTGPNEIKSIAFIVIGIAAMLLGRNPNGIAGYLFKLGRWGKRAVIREEPPVARTASGAREREEVSVGG
jgi:branched-chain amino acid transport system permease protein